VIGGAVREAAGGLRPPASGLCAAIGFLLAVAACSRAPLAAAEDTLVTWSVSPSPAVTGPCTVEITLHTASGVPIRGAKLEVEGNMSHAGMKPSLGTATEVQPGVYRAPLELTMGGDWFLLIEGALPDGRKLERKLDLPGVKSR